MLHRASQFINYDLWRIRESRLSSQKSRALRVLRTVVLSLKQFGNHQDSLRASSLTFYTLLSIVPVFAMAFGIAKGFGLEKVLEEKILERTRGQEEVMRQIVSFARSMLENTQGEVVAGVGVLVLFWSAIKMLENIESAFNYIWGVKKERPLARKFSDYLSMLVVCPIIVIFSGSLNIFLVTQIHMGAERFQALGYVSPVLLTLLSLIPFGVLWGFLAFLYVFMPNVKIQYQAAILGGFFASVLYQIVQWIYISFQFGASSWGAIYGSFAALPLFLIWLQISWLIVLYGAEIAFAYQYEQTYELEWYCQSASRFIKNAFALEISALCLKQFSKSHPVCPESWLAETLDIPIRLLRERLQELQMAGILTEVKMEGQESSYQFSKPLNLKAEDVLVAIEKVGKDEGLMGESGPPTKGIETLEKLHESAAQSASNLPLKDL